MGGCEELMALERERERRKKGARRRCTQREGEMGKGREKRDRMIK